MQDIVKKLTAAEWRVVLVTKKSRSLHVTKGAVETEMETLRHSADITVYKRTKSKCGQATVRVHSLEEIPSAEKEALALVRMKKSYSLPRNSKKPSPLLYDPKVETVLLSALWKRLSKEKFSGEIVSAEFEAAVTQAEVRNSSGLRSSSKRSILHIEAAYVSDKGEHNCVREFVRVKDFDPKEFAKESRLALGAKAGKGSSSVLLSGTALRDFWHPHLQANPIIFHATGRAVHQKLSRYKKNARLCGPEVTITSSHPDWNPSSSSFDMDGIASRPVVLVQQGLWYNLLCSKRYADYLDTQVTGPYGITQLSPGNEAAASLRKDALEIVSFSSFVPNPISGDFSAEVRLGYQNGKPVQGLMFSGNIFEILKDIRLGKEVLHMDGYEGPLVRFDNVSVSPVR